MSINLIPPKLKEIKKEERILRLFGNFTFFYLVLFCFLTGVLFLADSYIKKNIATVNSQIEIESAKEIKYKDTEKQVEEINAKLVNIKLVSDNRIVWSTILEELSKCTPAETQIKTLSSSIETGTISLTGYAASRRDIAKFKDKLESSNYFKNVNFTTSSYNQTENNYTYNLTADLEKTQ
jgi:Tfp pilus assembly protein PilN